MFLRFCVAFFLTKFKTGCQIKDLTKHVPLFSCNLFYQYFHRSIFTTFLVKLYYDEDNIYLKELETRSLWII